MRTISTTDLAHRLRPVHRPARAAHAPGSRWRPDADPDRRAGDDLLPRAADAVRARRAREDPAADRHPRARAAGGAGPGRAHGRSRRPALVAARRRRRPARRCSRTCASARTRSWPSASTSSPTTTSPRSTGPPRSWSGCSPSDRHARAHVQLTPGPELPQVLLRPGDLDHRQLDADRRRDVADGEADRLRRVRRADRRPAVPPDPAVRRLGRAARRPDVQADAADHHAAGR